MALELANRITFLRMFCIPFFIVLVIYYDHSVLDGKRNDLFRICASLVFLVTFLLDALDGYIARHRGQITRLGTIIDPLADKALLLSGLILLSNASPASYQAHLPVWFVWLVLSRDAMLVAGAVIVHLISGNVTVKPRISGKVTTFLQASIIVWIITDLPQRPFTIVLWSAALFTVVSGIQYFLDGIRQFERT